MENNYEQPLPIVRDESSTVFTGTAGQLMDPYVYERIEALSERQPVYTIQPVVRLHGRKSVGKKEGFSTSFALLATEQYKTSLKTHLTRFENWVEVLSKAGLYAGDLTLHLTSDNPDWGAGEFNAEVIKVYYKGLELGVGNYFLNIPQPKHSTTATMSDFTFGLERITWAARKGESYFSVFSPLPSLANTSIESLDAYRTLTLLSASNVGSGHKGTSSKYKDLANTVFIFPQPFRRDLVMYYYDWWRQFQNLPQDKESTINRILVENYKRINLALKKQFRLPDDVDITQSTEDIIRLAQARGIPDDTLIQFMKSN